MKKNLLFAFIIISISARAQTSVYHPFADSGAVWVMRWTNACTMVPCILNCTADYQYRIDGDTIISGNTYKKVLKEGFSVNNCNCIMNVPSCAGSTYSSSFYLGIRDDIVNRKSYINNGIDPEELFFDFNLTVGDSVRNRYCYQKIVGIDSVLIGSNYRKSYALEFFGTAVEGIGYVDNTYDGPFEACGPCVCNDMWELQCYRLNGVTLWGDTACALVTSAPENHQNNKVISLSPNPALNELTVKSSGFGEIDKIEIFNVLGEKNFSWQLTAGSQKQFSLDVSFLNAGIYFVKVKGQNKEGVIKLIKE